MKVKIIYIHPSKYLDKPSYCVIPVGIPSIVNYLIKHLDVEVVGVNIGMELSINSSKTLNNILFDICNYDIVLCDLHWYEHSEGAIRVAEYIKSIKNIPVIMGGLTSTIFAEQIMVSADAIDYIIKGDGEVSLKKLIEIIIDNDCSSKLQNIPGLVYRRGTTIVTNPGIGEKENLNNLDFSKIEFLRNWNYYYRTSLDGVCLDNNVLSTWICLGKGCKYNCIYCGGNKNVHKIAYGRDRMEFRDPNVVWNEICHYMKQGVSVFKFNLDLDILPKDISKSLLNRFNDNKYRNGIYNEFWQLPSWDLVNDIINTCNNLLCNLIYSPVTGDEKLRYKYGKYFTNNQFIKHLERLAKEYIPVTIYFSTNLPGETDYSFEQTIELANKIKNMFPKELLEIYCEPHTIEPISDISLHNNKYKIKNTLKTFEDYRMYCREKDRINMLGFDNFTIEQLEKRKKRWNQCFNDGQNSRKKDFYDKWVLV